MLPNLLSLLYDYYSTRLVGGAGEGAQKVLAEEHVGPQVARVNVLVRVRVRVRVIGLVHRLPG